jgi:lipoprotein-anchoring transpeptidase ErfK/SrfK
MNSLKTLFVSAILVTMLYGVYLAMNRGVVPTPPPEVAAAWDPAMADGGLKIEPGVPMRMPSTQQNQARVPTASKAPKAQPGGPAPQMSMSFNVPDGGPGGPAPTKSTIKLTPPKQQPTRVAAAEPKRVLASPPQVSLPPAVPKTPQHLAEKSTPPVKETPKAAPTISQRQSFAAFMVNVRGELDRKELLDAYRLLSRRYRDPIFTPEQNREIERLLDQLAGTIVYSTQHFIEEPYSVGPNETLEQIAARYNVPAKLLAKINGLVPSQNPRPGSQLKVVRGPFSAEIDLNKHELTLRLPDGGYAGRFPIGVGRDIPQVEKSYRVNDKVEAPVARPVSPAATYPAPFAKQKWIGLDDRLGIHAASNPADVGRSGGQGGISLKPRDVDDLYDILSVGSTVVIRR